MGLGAARQRQASTGLATGNSFIVNPRGWAVNAGAGLRPDVVLIIFIEDTWA